jgi:regulator of sigma E protease
VQHPTPWAQVKDVCAKMAGTFSALAHSKQTGVGAKDLSGPVGILAVLASQVNSDYRLALSFLVLLNINLTFINLLPIPMLDGGHILMAIIEKIRRRPLSIKFVEYTTTGFAVLLISFMLYVTFFDIKRLSLFRAMFTTDVQIQQSAPPVETAPARIK